MTPLLKIALCTCMTSLWLSACSGSDPLNATQASDSLLNQLQALPQDDEGVPVTGNAVGPEGSSQVEVDGRRVALKSAIGDIWGPDGDHYSVDFTITNGKFVNAPTDIGGTTHNLLVPGEASATVYVELYSPGEALSFGTYSFSPFGSGGGVLAGNAYFDSAYVGIDVNQSGDIEPNENFNVIGGTFDFDGVLPDIELRFSVTLENGQQAEGYYTGLFDFVDRI